MNSYQIIILSLIILLSSGTFVNTTDFWQKTLGVNTTHYTCYSGTNLFMKVMKKSIGIIPKDSRECTTVCFPQLHKASLYLINESPL